jgi:hypothetical protein
VLIRDWSRNSENGTIASGSSILFKEFCEYIYEITTVTLEGMLFIEYGQLTGQFFIVRKKVENLQLIAISGNYNDCKYAPSGYATKNIFLNYSQKLTYGILSSHLKFHQSIHTGYRDLQFKEIGKKSEISQNLFFQS